MPKQTTFYATYADPTTGETTTGTRTSHRAYTYASAYRTSKGIGFSYHLTQAAAAKGSSDWGSKPVAVVNLTTEAPAAVEPAPVNETQEVETAPTAPVEPESQNGSETDSPAYLTAGGVVHLVRCPGAARTKISTDRALKTGMREISQDEARALLVAKPSPATLCDACAELTGTPLQCWKLKGSAIVHTRRCGKVTEFRPTWGQHPITADDARKLLAENPKRQCKVCAAADAMANASQSGSETAPVETAAPVEAETLVSETAPAQAPKTNKGATKAVIRNLHSWYYDGVNAPGWQSGEVAEHLHMDSVESFRADAVRYLSDRSELRKATLDGADWAAVWEHFRPVDDDGATAAPEQQDTTVDVGESDAVVDVEQTGAVTFASDAELGGNLVQAVLALASLAEQGRAVRIESGPLAGVEDALLAAAPALALLHRARVGERVSAGLSAAAEAGRKGGRPKSTDDATRAALVARIEGGETVTEAAKALGLSRATAYRLVPKAK